MGARLAPARKTSAETPGPGEYAGEPGAPSTAWSPGGAAHTMGAKRKDPDPVLHPPVRAFPSLAARPRLTWRQHCPGTKLA